MSVDWQRIAVAIASKVQYEVACGRDRLLRRLWKTEAIHGTMPL
jgi:hypothetical protein